jgi:hypothetical protein
VRLRPLSEAECYARCYGDRGGDVVKVVPRPSRRRTLAAAGERLREQFEQRLDTRPADEEAA